MITKLAAVLACLALVAAACADDTQDTTTSTSGPTTTTQPGHTCAPEAPAHDVGENVPIPVHATKCDEQSGRSLNETVMKDIDEARQGDVVERMVASPVECLDGGSDDGFLGAYYVDKELLSTTDPEQIADLRRELPDLFADLGVGEGRQVAQDFGGEDLVELYVYSVESDPLEASERLRQAGIEVSPNYAVFTTPGYMFGPATDPVPAMAAGTASASAGGEPIVAVVDTGFSPGAPGQPLTPLDGHGLFASGLVAMAAPGAGVVAVEVGAASELAYGESTVFETIMTDLAGNPLDIVNMSLGAYGCPGFEPLGLRAAVDNLLALDPELLVVAAAGNDGWDNPFWPAALGADPAYADRVVGVGSAANGTRSPWSNFGDSAQVCANGEDVVSSYPAGVFTYVDGTTGEFDGAAIWSGTSFAAPIVAGAVASAFDGSARSTWQAIRSGFSCP